MLVIRLQKAALVSISQQLRRSYTNNTAHTALNQIALVDHLGLNIIVVSQSRVKVAYIQN